VCASNDLVLFGQDIRKREKAVDGHLTDFLYSRTHISLPQRNERAYIRIILI
jgi:hypothetical protein